MPTVSSLRRIGLVKSPVEYLVLLCAAAWLLLGSGCSHYQQDSQLLASRWVVGNYEGAAQFTELKLKETSRTDRLLWLLEAGSSLRAAGRLLESQEILNQADQLMAWYAERPSFSITDETGALLTNQSFIPYTGTAYDRIMVNTYKALNAIELKNWDAARVEFNRALEQQRSAVRLNATQLEKAQQEARKAYREVQGVTVKNEQQTQRTVLNQLSVQDAGLEAYANYVNPFTTFLEALYFKYCGVGSSDLERARFSFQRVYDMNPRNHYLADDLEGIQRLIDGRREGPLTYVIIENGMGPIREEMRLDLPLFVVSNDVPYIGVNFPKLTFRGGVPRRYQFGADGKLYTSEFLSSMDNVIASEFNRELPLIVTKTIISATIKAAAQYAIKESTKDSGAAGSILQIASLIYQYAVNEADLRIWSTLPKEFLYARFPTPQSGQIQMAESVPGAVPSIIPVVPGVTNIVYLRVPSVNTYPYISVSQLP